MFSRNPRISMPGKQNNTKQGKTVTVTTTSTQKAKPQATPTVKVVVENKNQGKRKNRRRGNTKRGGPRMSECASKYLAAIARPFSTQALGACLPFPPDRDSLKVTSVTRFTLTTDGSGNSFALIAPVTVNDMAHVWYSAVSGSLPINVTALNTAPANYSFTYASQLPFSSAQLIGSVEARIVAVGFRVTYLGSVSTMSGVFYAYSEPSHQSLNLSQYSGANIFSTSELKIRRISDKPFEMGFTVVNELEHGYTGYSDLNRITAGKGPTAYYPWSTSDIYSRGINDAGALLNGSAPILFGTSAAPANAALYVEVIQHVEYVGKGASYGLTPSHNDITAANHIAATSDRASAEFGSKPESSWSSVVTSTFNKIATEHGSSMGKMAVSAAARAARTYVGRRRGQLALRE